MSQQDDPPILISEKWQQRDQPPQTAAVEAQSADLSDTEPELATVSEPTESGAAATELSGQQSDDPTQQEPFVGRAPDHLAMIHAELSALRAETAHVNGILDRLHAENERLRRGETEQLLQPLFRDLIKLADDWSAMAASWDSKETATPADVARKCRDVAEDAGLILERYGVDSLAPAIGAAVERRQHRVVGTVRAEHPDDDNTVAEVRRAGYVYGEKIIKFAEVIATKHER